MPTFKIFQSPFLGQRQNVQHSFSQFPKLDRKKQKIQLNVGFGDRATDYSCMTEILQIDRGYQST